jgi:hypothetical protein
MSRNVFLLFFRFIFHTVACLSKRVQKYNFFFISQEIFKVFFQRLSSSFLFNFLPAFSNNLRILRGANVTSVFKSHKLFKAFFLEINF